MAGRAVFQPFEGGVRDGVFPGGWPAGRIETIRRLLERWAEASWCESLWHDALSDAGRTLENVVIISTARWSCCGSCRVSRS